MDISMSKFTDFSEKLRNMGWTDAAQSNGEDLVYIFYTIANINAVDSWSS